MTIFHVAALEMIEEIYVAQGREEAITRFVADRGFPSIEKAAEHQCLTEKEFIESLLIKEIPQ